MLFKRLLKQDECTPKYGLIRRSDEKCGLGSYIITIAGGIYYCLEHNLIPIVDLKNGNNMYKESLDDNAWEHFFKQPYGMCLEDIDDYKSCSIIDAGEMSCRPKLTMDFLTNENGIAFWRDFVKKYIVLSGEAKEVVDKYLEEYLPGDTRDKTIGVLARGTDYLSLQPLGHPVQPSITELIREINKVSEKTGYKRIFLATEDKSISDALCEEYGENVILPNSERFCISEKAYLADVLSDRTNVKMGQDYLASLIVLANCRCLVAGRTSGTVVAKLFSNGFEEEVLFNLGMYKIDDKESLHNEFL